MEPALTMGITSKLFITLLAAGTLLLCGLTVWLWPRAAGPGPRAVSGRITLLLSSQLTLVATFAAFCNAYFGFYVSWSDLFGATSQHYKLSNQGAVPATADAAQLAGGPITRPGPATGEVVTTTVVGLRSGISARLRIYLPSQYFDPQRAHADFPAIVVDGAGRPGSAALAADVSAHPPASPVVVVIVDTVDGRPLGCTGQPGGVQGALFWGQDLRSAISAQYRVGLGAQSWGVLGVGPAGDCAISLALQDAGRFSAAATVGPWTTPGTRSADAFDPAQWLRSYPAPPSRLLLAGLGRTVQSLLGPVSPPLQVAASADPTVDGALSWLAQTLHAGSAP